MEDRSHRLRARWVFPVSSAPIEGGIVEISAGRIVSVGRADTRAGRDVVDLGNVAIIPGLVNAHTHLEFSNLEEPLGPPEPFAAWIGSVVRERFRRRAAGPDPIASGLNECLTTGTAAVGEISTASWAGADDCNTLIDASAKGLIVPFRELLCPVRGSGELDAVRLGNQWDGELRQLGAQGPTGISPHTPFTTTRRLQRESIAGSLKTGSPVAMHLAETLDELELLSNGSGRLVEMLDRRGMWDDGHVPRGTRPLDILRRLWLARRALVVHGNYLRRDELGFLGRHSHMSLVYCPRTHRYFGHSRYPLVEALQFGVRVALGTDSRASNPDLNLWEEARLVAAEFPELSVDQVLALATRNGAEALGLGQTHGCLEAGRPAHLACLRLPEGGGARVDSLFERDQAVCGAMQHGLWSRRPDQL